MRAGPLKYKLVLMKPTRGTDRMGGETSDYEDTVTVWAERVRFSGARSEEVGEHFADYDAEFNIRDKHEVGENWRCRQLGGYLYTIIAIVPNIDKGYNTLICNRVNE